MILASRAAKTTPEHLVQKLSTSTTTPTRADDITFWDYLTLEELHVPRPRKAPWCKPKTAHNIERSIFQIYTDLGYTLPDRRVMNQQREAGQIVPSLPWEETAPPWEAILRWRDSKQKETLETQQKSLVRLAWYWGQGQALPYFLQTPWAHKLAVNRAKQAGTMRDLERFFDLPTEIQTLLGARPFTDKLRNSSMNRGRRDLVNTRRQAARYKDQLGRHMIFTLFYTGGRISEACTLRRSMYAPARGGIIGWPQPKKDMDGRDVILPKEPWLWHSKVDPSMDWFLTHVRPNVAPENEEPDPILWLNSDGEPWTDNGIRNFLAEYIHLSLGADAPGPHGLRRACATWRYRHGWDLEEVCLLLNDTRDVVESSYIDWRWIQNVGRTSERTRTRTPMAPLVRSNGTTNARHKKPEEQNNTAPPRHEEELSAPIGRREPQAENRSQQPPHEDRLLEQSTETPPAWSAGTPSFTHEVPA